MKVQITKMVVKIAVDKVRYSFDTLYSYEVKQSLRDKVFIGARVIVPFGNANSKRVGVILEIAKMNDQDRGLKSIYAVVDESAVLTDEMMFLAESMKKSCYCTFFDAVKSMVPSIRNLRFEKTLKLSEKISDFFENDLGEKEKFLVALIRENGGELKGKKLKDLEKNYKKFISKLETIGVLFIDYVEKNVVREKKFKYLRFNESFSFKLTEKQRNVVDFVRNKGKATVKEITYFTGRSESTINTLIKKGILESFDQETDFEQRGNCFKTEKREINLTSAQSKVYNDLKRFLDEQGYHTSLVKGITGSGKTMVILRLVDSVVESGKSVIFMLPEIALTEQVISIFRERYGENIAVIHSALSDKERLKEFNRIKNREVNIVIGTRTAVFAPVSNLGLVVIDEEHETTYKSEASPRFHARDIAILRCRYNKCMLVLASATPSVESYFLAKSGVYSLSTLNCRYGTAILPKTEIIDMNTEIINGNTTIFSQRLIDMIEEEMNKGRQSILLLNRRGYSTFVRCKDCRESIICPNCNITLNYHIANSRLMCHYCGYSEIYSGKCPKCQGFSMVCSGVGTQKAEKQIKEIFPNSRVLRVDADTKDLNSESESMFNKFSEGKYDIMIGTQMVAKGFNFPNTTLVGVLSADQALYGGDFRSYERAFSLITQVVGRCGRGKYEGKAVIQTFTPENPVIYLAAKQSYEDFYKEEIEVRKAMLYPPFSSICCIGFVGKIEKNVFCVSKDFFEKLKSLVSGKFKNLPLRIFKPSAALVSKTCGNYRYRIILKCKNDKDFRRMMSEFMVLYEKEANSKGVNVFVDMNPSFIV